MRAAHLEREEMKSTHRQRSRAAELDGNSGVGPLPEYLKIRIAALRRAEFGPSPRNCYIYMD